MRTGRGKLVFAGLLAVMVGCGGRTPASVMERAAVGKSDGVQGGEVLAAPASRSPVPGATRPARGDDVQLRAAVPTPVGVIDREHAGELVVRVEMHNASADPIEFGRVWVHSSVYQNDLLVPGCDEGELQLVTASPLELAPGQAFALEHALPCALPESGRYDVVSVVVVGAPPGAEGLPALRFSESVVSPLVVDADLPAFASR